MFSFGGDEGTLEHRVHVDAADADGSQSVVSGSTRLEAAAGDEVRRLADRTRLYSAVTAGRSEARCIVALGQQRGMCGWERWCGR